MSGHLILIKTLLLVRYWKVMIVCHCFESFNNTHCVDFEGCGFGIDTEWGIAWANTLVGEVDRQPCPGDAATLGQ